jgi:hypothetical protein
MATSRASRHSTCLAALVHGYRVAFLADAGLMLVAALAALALPAATDRLMTDGSRADARELGGDA